MEITENMVFIFYIELYILLCYIQKNISDFRHIKKEINAV